MGWRSYAGKYFIEICCVRDAYCVGLPALLIAGHRIVIGDHSYTIGREAGRGEYITHDRADRSTGCVIHVRNAGVVTRTIDRPGKSIRVNRKVR